MKSKVIVVMVVVLLMALFSVASAQTGTTAASAEIRDVQGRLVGNALLTQEGNGPVRVQVQVSGFDPGASQHGIHFHTVGACTPNFEAAGGHFNPASKQHGLNNPNGPHAGDLPNMSFESNGSGTFDATTDRITLGQGANSIFDADGTSILIHAGSDDQVTDPAGNSGARIACGVLVSGRGAAGTIGSAQGTATGSPMAAATAGATASATAGATTTATAEATAQATPAATDASAAGAAATPAATDTAGSASGVGASTGQSPATLPTTGGAESGLLAALVALGGSLAVGGAMMRRGRK